MPSTLEELAKLSGTKLVGKSDCKINAVNTLKSANEGEISFLSNRHYTSFLKNTRASAVILTENDLANCPTNALITDNPYLAYAKIAIHLYPDNNRKSLRQDNIVTGENCKIDSSVSISANVTIGNNVTVGSNTYIGPGCVIEDNVTVGNNCLLIANITLCHDIKLGDEIILHPGVVIGSDGFGLAQENKQWLKIPQIGSVIVSDKVEIGANSTIDRGAIEDTIIETGVKIDNQVQIGHNVIVGEHTAIAGCTGIAGSTIVGKRCMIGGAVGISGHIEIVDDVVITAMSGVSNSIKSPGVYSAGIPVTENKIWRRNIVRFRQLDELIKKIMNKLDND